MIVPIYNNEKNLVRCIESLLDQSLLIDEIILVNDCFSDDSWEIIQHYFKRFKSIIAINQENQGISSDRNLGLSMASSTSLGFVDADDWFEKEMYKTMINAAESRSADLVALADYAVFHPQKSTLGDPVNEIQSNNALSLLINLQLPLSAWAYLYGRDFIIGVEFDKRIHCFEDLLFNVQVICRNLILLSLSGLFYHHSSTPTGANLSSLTAKNFTIVVCCIEIRKKTERASIPSIKMAWLEMYVLHVLLFKCLRVARISNSEKSKLLDFAKICFTYDHVRAYKSSLFLLMPSLMVSPNLTLKSGFLVCKFIIFLKLRIRNLL